MSHQERRTVLTFLLVAGLMGTRAAGQVQQSHCADCHLVRPDAPGARHVSDWERSAHGQPDLLHFM